MTAKELNPLLRPTTPEIDKNLEETARRINLLEELTGIPCELSTNKGGFRSDMDQLRQNHKCPKSAHTTGQAADLKDVDGKIYDFLINNEDMVIKLDLYIEQKTYTKTWIHVQWRPTHRRFFIPY